MIKYFVSYTFLLGLTPVPGNAEVNLKRPITGIEDVNEIQKILSEKFQVNKPILISFQRFEKDTNNDPFLS